MILTGKVTVVLRVVHLIFAGNVIVVVKVVRFSDIDGKVTVVVKVVRFSDIDRKCYCCSESRSIQ